MGRIAITKVRDVAIAYLYLPLHFDSRFPVICHHPFTQSNFVALGSGFVELQEGSPDAENWRKEVRSRLEKASLSTIFMFMSKPYYLSFLKDIQSYLPINEFSKWLAYAYKAMEFPLANMRKAELLKMFYRANTVALMDSEDLKVYKKLPDQLTVYRGALSTYKLGLSWTLDYEKAVWFAKRFGNVDKGSNVYVATIPKDKIFCYWCQESEVVLDPKYLKSISKIDID